RGGGGARSLGRSARASAAVLGFTFGMAAARLCAAIAVAASLGIPHPVLAALVILPALDVASVFPITPGGVGIGSGAVAVALAGRGIGMADALGAGTAIQALESAAPIAAGSLGILSLAQSRPAARWVLRVATAGASLALVAALGAVVFDLT